MKTLLQSACLIVLGSLSSCAPTQQANPKEVVQQPSYITQGNQYARDGLLREAVDAYKKALQKEPDNATAHRNLGIVFVKAGDFVGAITHLEKSMASFEDNYDANYYLGEAYRANDKYGEAIFRYKSALKIQKDDPRALKSLAWSYYKIRYYSEALLMTQKLTALTPKDDQVPIILARIYLKLKREKEALALLHKGSERAPAASQPYYQSVEAEVQYAMGATNEALATYRKCLKTQPMLAGALLGAGRILLEQGKSAEAIDYLERAVRVKPKLYESHYYLGKALETSNPQRAMRYYAFFRKNASTDPELVDMVQDAKKRVAALSSTTTLNNLAQ